MNSNFPFVWATIFNYMKYAFAMIRYWIAATMTARISLQLLVECVVGDAIFELNVQHLIIHIH